MPFTNDVVSFTRRRVPFTTRRRVSFTRRRILLTRRRVTFTSVWNFETNGVPYGRRPPPGPRPYLNKPLESGVSNEADNL